MLIVSDVGVIAEGSELLCNEADCCRETSSAEAFDWLEFVGVDVERLTA
jgi:hypothetical protein